MKKNTIHRDGTVTYWSVYNQVWVERANPSDIPDQEYAAMSSDERERILAVEVIARCHGCGCDVLRKNAVWQNGDCYCPGCAE